MRVVIPTHGDALLDLEVGEAEQRGRTIHALGRAVIPIGEQELHVELPVEAEVTLDASGQVTEVQGAPDAETIAEAASFGRQLLSSNAVAPASHRGYGATHGIEIDERGRKILRRKGYRAF